MRAFILNIGDEVLSGKTINTNSSFIAQELNKLSIPVAKIVVVGDDEANIKKEVEEFRKGDLEIFISTGGLGPTHDDLSKEAIISALGLDMNLNLEVKAKVDQYFNNDTPLSNLKQAYFPKEAIIIENNLGTAPGAIIPFEGKHYFILVGPPTELKPMVQDCLNYLKNLQNEQIILNEYLVMGEGESFFEDLLLDLINSLKHVSLTPYASVGKIRFQIKALKKYEAEFIQVKTRFEELMDKYIISKEDKEVEEVLYELLKKHNYKISFAESITGGMLASTFINVSGASYFINESFITYSNASKQKILKVSENSLLKYGEVSAEVVQEMVEGLQTITKADVCLAVSGYAGPSGKDVGLVYYALKIKDSLYISKARFRGDRQMVRTRATLKGLYKIVALLRDKS